ncbi:MAG: hypothetical protein K0S38_255 [Candidatus Paceibacter sp.]|jgi:hypothetical protein|nr:hypothetical protein [Candidatus Paceibacter sp.]
MTPHEVLAENDRRSTACKIFVTGLIANIEHESRNDPQLRFKHAAAYVHLFTDFLARAWTQRVLLPLSDEFCEDCRKLFNYEILPKIERFTRTEIGRLMIVTLLLDWAEDEVKRPIKTAFDVWNLEDMQKLPSPTPPS